MNISEQLKKEIKEAIPVKFKNLNRLSEASEVDYGSLYGFYKKAGTLQMENFVKLLRTLGGRVLFSEGDGDSNQRIKELEDKCATLEKENETLRLKNSRLQGANDTLTCLIQGQLDARGGTDFSTALPETIRQNKSCA